VADDPQPELHSSTDNKLSHEGKKKCNRNFQPRNKHVHGYPLEKGKGVSGERETRKGGIIP